MSFFVQIFIFLILFFAPSNMHFLYFSVMCIGILQILSGDMFTFDLEVMIDFVFWFPTLPPKTLKWIHTNNT